MFMNQPFCVNWTNFSFPTSFGSAWPPPSCLRISVLIVDWALEHNLPLGRYPMGRLGTSHRIFFTALNILNFHIKGRSNLQTQQSHPIFLPFAQKHYFCCHVTCHMIFSQLVLIMNPTKCENNTNTLMLSSYATKTT